MKRFVSAVAAFSMAGVILGGCDQESGPSFEPSAPEFVDCHQYTSCTTCTPVPGCGWCYLGNGTGECARDPNRCSSSTVFTWTWDPSGCYESPDAGVAPASPTFPSGDAGAQASDAQAAATATTSSELDAEPSPDALVVMVDAGDSAD